VFNIQPGQGLGSSASKQIAFGLGTIGGKIKREVLQLVSSIQEVLSIKSFFSSTVNTESYLEQSLELSSIVELEER